jgi:hypothetical protein
MPAPRLVYVASIGRSGSTLLELLLGAHPDIATIGELHLWPHEIRAGRSRLPCGCGLPLDECAFWQEMRRRVDPLEQPPPRLDHFREHLNHGRTLRPERLRDFTAVGTTTDDMRTYAANTARVVEAFADLAADDTGRRPTWVVDASKDPYRLCWLARSGVLDLTVLHVVRDPRGFVNSERRNVEGVSGVRLAALAARKSGAWVVQHALVERATRLLPSGKALRVPYEQLATDPSATLARVWEAVGCTPCPEVVDTFRDRASHAVGGNPMRHRGEPIALDEAWRRELPAGPQRIATALTAPTRWRHR